MAGAGNEKNFKRCLKDIITVVDNEMSRLQTQGFDQDALVTSSAMDTDVNPSALYVDEQELLDRLKRKLERMLADYLPSLSQICRNYLLDVLYQHQYDYERKIFTSSFNTFILCSFLRDLQGTLASLDAFQAAWNGERTVIEEFIKTYPKFKNKSGLYGTTLLYSAAKNNHLNLVKYLISVARCSVNAQNQQYLEVGLSASTTTAQHFDLNPTVGSTALHGACFNGHLDIVKYLIKHGADYFIQNHALETPIMNAKSRSNICQFFKDFLIRGYSLTSNSLPHQTICEEKEANKPLIVDCVWEYKPVSDQQWFAFSSGESAELQQSLIVKPNQQFRHEVHLKASDGVCNVSLLKFLRSGEDLDQTQDHAWVRCRGSSLLNFDSYSRWQIMFINHPTLVSKSSPSLTFFDIPTTHNSTIRMQLNSWYNCNTKTNSHLDEGMNYRRKSISLKLDFIGNDKLKFDLQNFTFHNDQKTIFGFVRWIPKIISNSKNNRKNIVIIDNVQTMTNLDPIPLTMSRLKQAQASGTISKADAAELIGDMNADDLASHSILSESDDDDDFDDLKEPSTITTEPKPWMHVRRGDLTAQHTDAIVICSSSKYLLESVFRVGGKSVKTSYYAQMTKNPTTPVITVASAGKLAVKKIYFLPWQPDPDVTIFCKSIEQFVSNAIEQAAIDNYRSIAFPAIGCGQYGCSISLVAQTIVEETHRQLAVYPMSVSFVIQADRADIYHEFRKQIDTFQEEQSEESPETKTVSVTIGKGRIEVEKGDITTQKVDVIIGSSSSEGLMQFIIQAAGSQVETAYKKEYKNNPNSLIISTPSGQLPCKRIFFLKWEPDRNDDILRQSIVDFISNVIQNVKSYNFTSIAFPAIGCGEYACSVDIVVKTMVQEIKNHIKMRKLPWTVKFVIQPGQQNIYDEFCKQVLSSQEDSGAAVDHQLPSTWQHSTANKILFVVPNNTDEYQSLVNDFDQAMRGKYTRIIKIERIQNERWYMQYLAHSRDFKKRLNKDTEKRLYHGCPQHAAVLIIEDCFNRSFAGVNGTSFGVGVYFSADATYSHEYAKPNSNGERCMFVSRVLIGKTTKGNSSMKTRPVGFDSTTDGKNIFVTYHDAQAFAEYLITYK